MIGELIVKLKGVIGYKKLNEYNNFIVLNLDILIYTENRNKYKKIKAKAFEETAILLDDVSVGTYICAIGYIENSSYTTKCKYCNGPVKQYWTEFVITSFNILNE